jgi:hypothetical protein
MAKSRANRRNTRRNRRNTRKNRRTNRRNTRRILYRRNNMMGGATNANSTGPAPVNYGLAQTAPAAMSLAQGNQFASYHVNQHGGEAPLSQITYSTLPQELHASARTLPLDGYFNDIRGLKDPNQMGAGRRKGRKGRFAGRKSRKGRKTMKGGAATYNFHPASTTAPGLLLDADMEARAVRGMNPEWYLAKDPNSFTPRS